MAAGQAELAGSWVMKAPLPAALDEVGVVARPCAGPTFIAKGKCPGVPRQGI
jgi:hypothetical protein